MKFIYSSDIHGDENKYEKLLEVALKMDIKYIVLGGDLYPKRGDREVIQLPFITGYLDKYFSKLKKNDIKCIFIPGNDDLENFDEAFEKVYTKYDNVYNVDNKKSIIEDCCFIGCSKILDSPFVRKNRVVIEKGHVMEKQKEDYVLIDNGKKRLSVDEWKIYRETIEQMIEALNNLPNSEKDKKTIYVLHDPPYGIGLDECHIGMRVGSKDMVKFLEKSNAYMSLHGHIHESYKMSGKWFGKIGNTICIQAGQTELNEKDMYYVVVDTEKDEYERVQILV